MKCFVSACTSDFHGYKFQDSEIQEGFTKHRFPEDLNRRIAWLDSIAKADNRKYAIREINFKSVLVCSRHFLETDFYYKDGRKRLTKTAKPVVFECSSSGTRDVSSGSQFHDSGFDEIHDNQHVISNPLDVGESVVPVVPPDLKCRSQLHDSGFGEIQDSQHIISDPPNAPPASKRRRTLRYAGDINNKDITPEEALIVLPKVQAQLSRSQKTVKLLRSQNKRLRDRLSSMQELMNKLASKNMLSNASSVIIQSYSSNQALFEELRTRTNKQACSDALRSFATTLHFYSPKAYSYVRNVFNKTLPHPRTIIRWYESLNGEPGITKETLDMLRLKAADMKATGKRLLGCLLMDEMAIRQQVTWNEQTKKLEGIVQHHSIRGSNTERLEQAPAAKEALVFMITGIQDSWKIPIAYFLINGMTADEKKEIINTVLISLQAAGVTIVAFTFDGTVTNIATANALGCNIRLNSELKTFFQHPSSEHNVYVLLDTVHMLKLVRNTLHSQKVLISPNGSIKWDYIEKLNNYQNTLGIKLAPKLSHKHVFFENSKMKVRLAVQVVSNSVAMALDQLKAIEPDFEDCTATVEFLSLFNDLFDITNSMDTNAQHFKKPMSVENFDLYHEAFSYIEDYIRNLRLSDGSKLLQSKCKTGFLGFLVALKSFKSLFETYVEETGELDQIFAYRFSQDHLEHFFGAVRSKNGSNNNPNSVQCKASYKRLIVHNEIKNTVFGNCQNFENIVTITVMSTPKENQNSKEHQQLNPAYSNLNVNLIDYNDFMADAGIHAAMNAHAVEVLRKLLKQLKCQSCSQIVDRDTVQSIASICKAAEFEFKALVGDQRNVNFGKYYSFIMANSVIRAQNDFDNLFDQFWVHSEPVNDHKMDIIKRIIVIYLDIRMKLYSKKMIPFKPTNRQKLTKLILFEGN